MMPTAKKGAKGMRAGGRATEAGMSFQAEVGAFLAAQMLAGAAVGQGFSLKHDERIVALRFESGSGVDDVIATLSGGGKASLQCKTSLSLSSGETSDFAKTIGQFVEELVTDPALDPAMNALAITLPVGEAKTLDTLEAACRRVAAGGLLELKSGSEKEREAFETLKVSVDRAWKKQSAAGTPDYRRLTSLLRVRRYERGDKGAMRIDGAALLGRALYGGDSAGAAPFAQLLDVVRELIKSGHPVDRRGLLAELRRRGQVDVSAPGFDADIARLKEDTEAERARLDRFGRLPLNNYPLQRSCQSSLLAAARTGSFLVIGEPGAGKSGALGALAADWEGLGPVVVFSVDRFASITKSRDLPDELRLEHDVAEVLAAWPGEQPGLLIIDALDAARGGQAEAIFVNLIEQMAKLSPRWRVVASVRTFDLLNGQRLRQLMVGASPVADYVDPRASMLRHFLIPALDADERAKIAADLPGLAALLSAADRPLAKLLSNIFNLSLAADLVASGVDATKFDNVATQSDLIDRYEDRRLPGIAARSAMIAAIGTMVERGSLSLRVAGLDHVGLDDLLTSGILTELERRYAFAHHILFDHAAGRYFVDDTADGLIMQLRALGAKAFMLAPALRFALERFWRQDSSVGHAASWKLLVTLAQQRDLGPIAAAAALRTAAEQVARPDDLAGLTTLIKNADAETIGNALYQIARFVAMRMEAETLPDTAVIAWSGLAETIADSRERWFVEPARFLLHPFAEKANLSASEVLAAFGKGARALLASACAQDDRYRHARSMGIDFVTKSYAADAVASRAALMPLLAREWMDRHGHNDARALAAGMKYVVRVDGEFVEQVFAAIFGQPLPDETKTDMSGSRILGLTSTKRQDFESSFYQLREVFRLALQVAPEHTPALLSIAALGKRAKKNSDPATSLIVTLPSGDDVVILLDGLDLSDWRQARDHGNPSDVDIPASFAEHVANAPFSELEVIIDAARRGPTAASVWRRLLGSQLADARRGPTDILLWEVAANPAVIGTMDLGRDAIDFLRAVYPTIDAARRQTFEEAASAYKPAENPKFWSRYAARLLTALPPAALVTQTMKRRRARLEMADGLVGNPAYMSHGDSTGRMLRAGGGSGAKSTVEKAVVRIARAVEKYRVSKGAIDLPPLWKAIKAGLRLINKGEVSDDQAQQLWGAVGEGFTVFVSSKAWAPGSDGVPNLTETLTLLDRLVAHPLPNASESDAGWSTEAVRVHAAKAALQLGWRFMAEAPSLEATISALLTDGNSNVRYVAAERLFWLASAEPDRMWRFIDQVATTDTNDHVLAALVAQPLSRLSKSDPEAVEKRLAIIDGRADALSLGDNPSVTNMIAQVATAMAVDDGRKPALALVEGWTKTSPIASTRLHDAIQMLRGRLFYGYLPDTDPRHASGARAEHIGEMAARAAAKQLAEAKTALSEGTKDGSGRDAVIAAYQRADSTLDNLVMQLYFGSGTYRESGGEPGAPQLEIGLNSPAQKIAFLNRWSDVLKAVEGVATPRTAKHLLEIYEFLLPADPPRLFERIANFVTGPAKEEFYQHEQLAASDLVEFVRHMLADYRALFDDTVQRDRLISMLDLFAEAGWPEAMRLLWEIPDLLR